MEHHVGRLLDHVHLRVADLEVSRRFYRAVLQALDLDIRFESEISFASDELYVTACRGVPHEADVEPSRVHLAFQADGPAQVQRFHAVALGAGGRDNGQPGERTYHPGYYAAFVLDPDGNNIEAVYHGPARRSAPSVVITPGL